MTNTSKVFRDTAADHLRKSRKATAKIKKEHHRNLAASYKNLAHDEELVRGETQRSKRKPATNS